MKALIEAVEEIAKALAELRPHATARTHLDAANVKLADARASLERSLAVFPPAPKGAPKTKAPKRK